MVLSVGRMHAHRPFEQRVPVLFPHSSKHLSPHLFSIAVAPLFLRFLLHHSMPETPYKWGNDIVTSPRFRGVQKESDDILPTKREQSCDKQGEHSPWN